MLLLGKFFDREKKILPVLLKTALSYFLNKNGPTETHYFNPKSCLL